MHNTEENKNIIRKRLQNRLENSTKEKYINNKKNILDILQNIKNNRDILNNVSKKRTKHRRFQQKEWWDIEFKNNNILFIDNNNIDKPLELLNKNVSFTLRGGNIYDELAIIKDILMNDECKIKKLSDIEINTYEYSGASEAYHILPLKKQKFICSIFCDRNKNLRFANCYVLTKTKESTKYINLFYTYIETKSNDEILKTYNYQKQNIEHIYSNDVDSVINMINLDIIKNNNIITEEIFFNYINHISRFPLREDMFYINDNIFSYGGKIDKITYETCLVLKLTIVTHLLERFFKKDFICNVDIKSISKNLYENNGNTYNDEIIIKNILFSDIKNIYIMFPFGLLCNKRYNDIILLGLMDCHEYTFYIKLFTYLTNNTNNSNNIIEEKPKKKLIKKNN